MIPHYVLDEPPIKDAIDRAVRAFDEWIPYGDAGDQKRLKDQVGMGWSGWSLLEAIALQILEAQGYDTESLEWIDERDIAHGWTLPRKAMTRDDIDNRGDSRIPLEDLAEAEEAMEDDNG
ncbi:MAG: hypothetical protein DWQ20_00855 [Actinobacteria bacterium]|nr:MAG: hypothetical protein DWQ20_00855 [Actinomycetota bacterium]